MTGFFALRPEVVDGDKILMEILAKGHVHRLAEELIVFCDREMDVNKVTCSIMTNYVTQLVV